MKFENGKLVVELDMGKTVYVGRAVDHGELRFDTSQEAWVQEVVPPVESPRSRFHILRMPKFLNPARNRALVSGKSMALASLLVLLCVAGAAVWKVKFHSEAAVLPVASYAAKATGPIEDVGEPYRPAISAMAPDTTVDAPADRGPLPIEVLMGSQPEPAQPQEQTVAAVTKAERPERQLPQLKQKQPSKDEKHPAPARVDPAPPQVQVTAAAAQATLPVGPPPQATQKQPTKDEKSDQGVLVNRLVDKPASPVAPTRIVAAPVQVAVAPTSVRSTKAQPERHPVRLVTVMDANTIVVSDPVTGIPKPVKVGAVLHDGSTLVSVDLKAGTAQTDKGTLRLE